MAPFRNFLSRKPAASSDTDPSLTHEDPRPSLDSQRSGPINFRRSRDEGPHEYKMSGMSCSTDYISQPLGQLKAGDDFLGIAAYLRCLTVVDDSGVYLPVWGSAISSDICDPVPIVSD